VKIGIYALAKNEAGNVARWEASSRDADIRVVTDTGSTDDTPTKLREAGVVVAHGAPIPWRWDDAHNLSLHHLPPWVDVAVRLDLDEELAPGWRDAIEAAWTATTTGLRYWYAWSSQVRFICDRVHTRAGYRWTGATHEGLVRWDGPAVDTFAPGLEIRHHRDPAKRHASDLTLLRQAVREAPADARMTWYLARELDYQQSPEALETFRRYLELPGGSATERAYARRTLAKLEPDQSRRHLLEAILESPREPEAYAALAQMAERMNDAVACLYYARHAAICPPESQTHASVPPCYGPEPCLMAARTAARLGLHPEALAHARKALERDATNAAATALVAELEQLTTEAGPKAA
jgi:tetratricopeptide (TPR) repeat protein